MYIKTKRTVNFKDLQDVLQYAVFDIRYASSYNFVGNVIDGYEEAAALLCAPAAKALKEAEEDFYARGYILKIWDAFRPQRAVDHFVRWAEDLQDTRMKEVFYPAVDKKDLFALGYIDARSSHTRGSTVDLTLVHRKTMQEADMGGSFDRFDPSSATAYADLCEEQLANRRLLREGMEAHGFKPLAEEWWHYTLKDEPYPDTYFDFPVRHLNNGKGEQL